MADFWDLLVLT